MQRSFSKIIITFILIISIFINRKVLALTEYDYGKITVSNITAGDNVTPYKIINVNYDYLNDTPSEPTFTWVDEVRKYIESTTGTTNDYSAYLNIDLFVKSVEEKNDESDKFINQLAHKIADGTIIVEASKTTSWGYLTNLNNLSMGTYLLVFDSSYRKYIPQVASIVPTFNIENNTWQIINKEIEAKIKEVSISNKTKGVENRTSVSSADSINFVLTADIPKYNPYKLDKRYYLDVILSIGLKLENYNILVYGKNGDDKTLLGYNTYTIENIRPIDFSSTAFTLNFNYPEISAFDEIYVEYNVLLNKDESITAGQGNTIKAYLDYTDNSNNLISLENIFTIYTYEIETINTKMGDSGILLSGAEFTLSLDAEGKEPLNFIQNKDGIYYRSNEVNTTNLLKVNNEGKLTLVGLASGEYYLTQISAPANYNKLNEPVEVSISNSNEAFAVESSESIINSSNGKVNFYLIITGIALFISGFIFLVINYQNEEKELMEKVDVKTPKKRLKKA